MSKHDDGHLSMHHLTAVHIRDAFGQLAGNGSAQEPLAQKHLTSAHLNDALQQSNQGPHVPSQQESASLPSSAGSSQTGKE